MILLHFRAELILGANLFQPKAFYMGYYCFFHERDLNMFIIVVELLLLYCCCMAVVVIVCIYMFLLYCCSCFVLAVMVLSLYCYCGRGGLAVRALDSRLRAIRLTRVRFP